MLVATDIAAEDHRRGLAWIVAAYATALLAAVAIGWDVREAHPIVVAVVADLVATAVVFAFSIALDNSSIYDPYWSVAPIPIALYWWWATPERMAVVSGRQVLTLALILVWATRLTANCLGRGRGLSQEDFRYVEIRQRSGHLYWPVSFVAIHLLPTAWVFLGLLPLYPALSSAGRPFGALDVLGVGVTIAAVTVEAAADRQLRTFLRARADPAELLDTGLWAWSRHPNYFGEVLFWWGLFLIGFGASPSWGWSVIGPLSITLLFVLASVPWMDRRMASRHPGWKERMQQTSALVPWPPRSR